MKKWGFWFIALILGNGFICAPALTSAASPAGDKAAAFYKGKTVEFVVPYNPGGGYDIVARLLQPYLAEHLGATVIVRNEPGAGAKVALNRLAKENNGLSIVTCAPFTSAMSQAFGQPGVRYDLTKFNWLGLMAKGLYPVVVSKRSGYKSNDDLKQAKEVKFAAPTLTNEKALSALLMGHILGINVKMVTGYQGSASELLALQRGEVDGLSTQILTILPYIQSQEVIPLVAMARKRFKLLPDVPTIFEVKKLSAQEERIAGIGADLITISRVVATTPGVPEERVAFLESALKKALEEPELVNKFKKIGMPIDYATGEKTAEAISSILSLSGDEKTLLGRLLKIKGY